MKTKIAMLFGLAVWSGGALAAYAISSRRNLAAQPFEDVVSKPAWSEIA